MGCSELIFLCVQLAHEGLTLPFFPHSPYSLKFCCLSSTLTGWSLAENMLDIFLIWFCFFPQSLLPSFTQLIQRIKLLVCLLVFFYYYYTKSEFLSPSLLLLMSTSQYQLKAPQAPIGLLISGNGNQISPCVSVHLLFPKVRIG